MADSAKTGNQEFGDLLREAREDRGMSRRDLAEATGLSYPYISQLETGYRLPSPSAIQTLSRVLRVSLDAIFATITSDEPAAAPRRRISPAQTGWVQNRAFAPAPSPAPAAGAAGVGAGSGAGMPPPEASFIHSAAEVPLADTHPWVASSTEAVSVVMDLLLRLPVDDRLHALAQIQQLVVRSAVEDCHREKRNS